MRVARHVLGLYARVPDVPTQTFPLGDDVYTTLVVDNYPKWPAPGPPYPSGRTPSRCSPARC
ncbi:hypothetical protein GCM10010345_71810 [Streptomyces canarius]|uniref:Uncharacterized protein n=1 Tax=Streptomyces canarius TaxID=285453 RepID=A0ABQ3D5Q9_9ACTN|nr:hypothetical protein [Streptomyces canarius]GHA56927.1 hypothetical protein GCM10010345_71810 [Streptomyces canarius]